MLHCYITGLRQVEISYSLWKFSVETWKFEIIKIWAIKVLQTIV